MASETVAELPGTTQRTNLRATFEAFIEGTKDARLRNILQMTLSGLDFGAVDALQSEINGLPEDAKLRRDINLMALPRQLVGAAPQVAALDLDRLPPLRILGLGRIHTALLFCAKALHHEVVVAYPSIYSYERLLRLYGIASHPQKKGQEYPEGPFHLIAAGNLTYGQVESWAEFLRRLAALLADDGRIFLTLARQPVPERKFAPDEVMAMFERTGAIVSRKTGSIVIEKSQIENLSGVTATTRLNDDPLAPPRSAKQSGEQDAHKPGAGAIGIAAAVAVVVAAAAAYWFTR